MGPSNRTIAELGLPAAQLTHLFCKMHSKSHYASFSIIKTEVEPVMESGSLGEMEVC